ncbi:MAG: NifU family protein [Clostridiales Family XIII bacterium]|jgi:Fe-S cluster biogenesis protein NfuA|nr:NifU family protein [Clostridiales Family XIII bacterium]
MATIEQIEKVLDDEVRPVLRRDGGDVEVVGIEEDGVVRIRLRGHCSGCPAADITTEQVIQAALVGRYPEIRKVAVAPPEIDEETLAFVRSILNKSKS